jgi:hypothetical protein
MDSGLESMGRSRTENMGTRVSVRSNDALVVLIPSGHLGRRLTGYWYIHTHTGNTE